MLKSLMPLIRLFRPAPKTQAKPQTQNSPDQVKNAAATARQVAVVNAEADDLEMAKRFEERIEDALPVEGELKARLREERLECLRHRHDRKYPRIDISFLKWRNKADGMPTFAVFSPSEPMCSFACNYEWLRRTGEEYRSSFSPYMPQSIKDMYSDIIEELLLTCKKRVRETRNEIETARTVEVRLRTQFAGAIPPDVRALVRKALETSEFESVYIAAQVDEWKVNEEVTTRPGDPLVIGAALGAFWLIAAFDTTPSEDIVAAEWATGPTKP